MMVRQVMTKWWQSDDEIGEISEQMRWLSDKLQETRFYVQNESKESLPKMIWSTMESWAKNAINL